MKTAIAGCAALVLLLSCAPAGANDRAGKVALVAKPAEIGDTLPALSLDAGSVAKNHGSGPSVSALATATTVSGEHMVSPPLLPVTLLLKADLAAQRLTVVEGDKVKFVWPISSGRAGYRTSTGTFRPQWTAKMWYSRQYEWSPMPHAVFFNRGTAFHATGAVGMLGRPASHGCIRLAPANAAQLYALVHRHGLYQTKIVVHGSPKEPAIAQRKHKRQPEHARAQGYGLSTYPVYAASGAVMRPGPRSVYRANAYGEGWPF